MGQEIVLEFRVYYTRRRSKAEPRGESDKSVHLWERNPFHSIHHSLCEYSNTDALQQQYELIKHESALGLGELGSLHRKWNVSLQSGWYTKQSELKVSSPTLQKPYFLLICMGILLSWQPWFHFLICGNINFCLHPNKLAENRLSWKITFQSFNRNMSFQEQ